MRNGIAVRMLVIAVAALVIVADVAAWKNPRKSVLLNAPVFGTHDYIAFKGYVLADRPSFLRLNLAAFFLGTEAPDNGSLLAGAIDNYPDATQCHCILFDKAGVVTRDRGELQVRREFNKARAALKSGDRPLAAFYAGALAHYLGDLSQFCHIMGKESHWGSEDDTLHGNYEAAIEKTINFKNRSSSLLDAFIEETDIDGDTPEEIARAVALFTGNGAGLRPGAMHSRYVLLKKKGLHLKADQWDAAFTDQTGHNVNAAANGIAKVLALLVAP